MNKPSPNWRRNVKAKACNRALPELMRRHKGLCHWCGRLVSMTRAISLESLVKRSPHSIAFIGPDGLIVVTGVATADHVKPASEGGGNGLANLVLACTACNGGRAEGKSQCLGCRRFVSIKKGRDRCRPCAARLRKEALAEAHGWKFQTEPKPHWLHQEFGTAQGLDWVLWFIRKRQSQREAELRSAPPA